MKRVFLIGYMGAGKTTVGKVLSRQLGLSFIDLDHYIEGRYHKTVGQLFAERGEEAFRDIERRMLREVATFEDGGAGEAPGTLQIHPPGVERTFGRRIESLHRRKPGEKGTFLFEGGDCVRCGRDDDRSGCTGYIESIGNTIIELKVES